MQVMILAFFYLPLLATLPPIRVVACIQSVQKTQNYLLRADNALSRQVLSQASYIPDTNHNASIVDWLWSTVESEHAVRHANRTSVIDAPSYIDIGPDPQKNTNFIAKTLRAGRIYQLHFPKDFVYGVSLSAAQSEGAVKADGRGPSLWDSWAHRRRSGNDTTSEDDNHETAYDIATNFRYLYPVDIARVKAMGMKTFAFSVSWSRVLPLGTGAISKDGLSFYEDLVREIKRQGMEPVVTLFHDDLPLALQRKFDGLGNVRIVEAYIRYAAVMFESLGKLGVKTWFTFNEPQTLCLTRLQALVRATTVHNSVGQSSKSIADDPSLPWKCAGHVLQAHAHTYELFKTLRSNGTLAKTSQLSYQNAGTRNVVFRDSSQHDKDARERYNDFTFGLFAEPVHKTGQYPRVVRDEVPSAWLPELSGEDRKRVRHSADFVATNFFSSRIIKATERQGGYAACIGNVSHIAWPTCTDDTDAMPDGQRLGEQADRRAVSPKLFNTAGTLREHLKWLYDEYPSSSIIVSALGWPERDENEKQDINDIRYDDGRQRYMRDHLAEMLLAIYKDGTPLRGVLFYNPIDVIDWRTGRALRYGLQSVDFRSANLTRTYKGSFFFIKNFFALHR